MKLDEATKSALKFFNLIDRAGKLSITNMAVYVLIVKLALSPDMDWAVVAGLLVTLLNYSAKKVIDKPTVAAELPSNLQEAIDAVKKTADEAKDMAQKLNLANGVMRLK